MSAGPPALPLLPPLTTAATGPAYVPVGHLTLHEVTVALLKALMGSDLPMRLGGDATAADAIRGWAIEEVVAGASTGDLEVLVLPTLSGPVLRVPSTCWASHRTLEEWAAFISMDRLPSLGFGALAGLTPFVERAAGLAWITDVEQRRVPAPDAPWPEPVRDSEQPARLTAEYPPPDPAAKGRWICLPAVNAAARARVEVRTGKSPTEQDLRRELGTMLKEAGCFMAPSGISAARRRGLYTAD